ncbi:nicotinate phosphoribosyltransferase [Mycolicibacterium mageritense]|uniref:nicotinate phosphoribosyltransferase n=1 Tax=Mycolicibacterium mageritense TaxID=53462 RepID=UPI001E2FCC5C|nr:nicotinate phosphoribosyltransferase [Mycolicibacterium mageritense]GJJ17846.1 nicotinate phosphoribosyltransferase [Mycolicibacterium mageritense]
MSFNPRNYSQGTLDALAVLMETDAYKLDHRRQYPDRTEFVYSNLTARGSRVAGVDWTVFFGLQAYLTDLAARWQTFFGADADEVCRAYEERVTDILGPNGVGSEHIRELHGYGRLPLRFRALPEGTVTPLGIPYLTVENTDPRFFWLTNYIETDLSAALWQPITSATTAWRNRCLLDARAAASGVDPAAVDWQGHDFSARGMAGMAAASVSGAAHLLSFTGNDSLSALGWIDRCYPGSPDGTVLGGSVPATEHSVMTANGPDGELATFERLLDLYPAGIVSVVSDSWDLWQVMTEFLPALRQKIMARDGKLVIRPDSGDPELILCGDPAAPAGSPQRKGVVNLLAETFGTTVNAAGFRELDPHVGVIYGDSINFERADAITASLMRQGYVSTTPVFGFGSYTYQFVTRDTFSLAVKATWVQVDGQGRDIFKDPVTDSGTKRSARGRLAVLGGMDGSLALVQQATADQEANSRLRTVFEDGVFLSVPVTFAGVRAELRASWARMRATLPREEHAA